MTHLHSLDGGEKSQQVQLLIHLVRKHYVYSLISDIYAVKDKETFEGNNGEDQKRSVYKVCGRSTEV